MFKKLLILLFLCATSALHAANYLTFTAEEDSSSFRIHHKCDLSEKGEESYFSEGLFKRDPSFAGDPDIQYSLDEGKTWTNLKPKAKIILAKKGDKALLRGNNPQGFSHTVTCTGIYIYYSQFSMEGRIAASGSVMSLVDTLGERKDRKSVV